MFYMSSDSNGTDTSALQTASSFIERTQCKTNTSAKSSGKGMAATSGATLGHQMQGRGRTLWCSGRCPLRPIALARH